MSGKNLQSVLKPSYSHQAVLAVASAVHSTPTLALANYEYHCSKSHSKHLQTVCAGPGIPLAPGPVAPGERGSGRALPVR